MTDDERLINETWPIIRETVEKYRPMLVDSGFILRVQYMPLEKQLAFWKCLHVMDTESDERVDELARQVRAGDI